MSAAARDGGAPGIDDPNGAVDSLTRALVEGTAADARRVGATPRVYRASLLDSGHSMMAANLRAVWRENIPIAMGTDAGNPLTLHGPSGYAAVEAKQKGGN